MSDAADTAIDPAPPAPPVPAAGPRRHPLRFTGSGSEYFRIWIVNLLLTVVTLGLYYPFAKLRRLRYFQANTHLDGHAFTFDGRGRAMLRGYLVVLALGGLYSVAGRVSPAAGLAALLVLMALWPALWRASMRFRFGNTRWRGLRFQFVGSLGGAYRALLPLFAPAALVGGVLAVAGGARAGGPGAGAGAVLLVAMLAGAAALPWLLWRLKTYQHGHYALGRERTQLAPGAAAVYCLLLKTALGAALAIALLSAVAFALVAVARRDGGRPAAWVPLASTALVYAALLFLAWPYWTSRLQNLVWSRTASQRLRFESDLRLGPLALLVVKNTLLTAVTLGLYWPFARVAIARLRLEAVAVVAEVPLDTLAADAAAGSDNAVGDAAGDMFGIDFGL